MPHCKFEEGVLSIQRKLEKTSVVPAGPDR
jgi:hypothetical protein